MAPTCYPDTMELDRDTCYRAVQSRDRRFDGRFFTGVKTTGIYCRPICPAMTPRPHNVEFYPCAAAAEQAGYRPCLRCRPETAPGTPAWRGSTATVARALRLIEDGALDIGTVTELAGRLGIGPRQLSRLFRAHLGASPVAVAQTRRVHFARNLIEHTELPMSRIALAAGFGSLRRFNTLIKSTFGGPPSGLRRRAETAAAAPSLTVRLAMRPPYDWDHLVDFLARRAVTGIEEIRDGAYRRTVHWRGKPGVIAVRRGGRDHLELVADLDGLDGAIALVARVRRMFDCDADPRAIGGHLQRDPLLAAAVHRRPGLRLPCAWSPWELAVRAVIGQRVSVSAATTITGRLVQRCGPALPVPCGGLTHLFPSPSQLMTAKLDGLGVDARRIRTVQILARSVAQGEIDLAGSANAGDLVARLAALSGIGPWTAQYVAMRGLGEPDAFPADDLGLKKAVPDGKLRDRAESWRPWRAYAALHLWAALGDER